MSVLEPSDRPFADAGNIGVVIEPTPHGYHSGILYCLPDGQSRVVHLAFHHDLRDEEATLPFRWAHINLDEDNKILLAYLVSRIKGSGTLIPYGFDASGICFDPASGQLLPAPSGKGLTCATFILAALRTYGYELVDALSWPERPEDQGWQQEMIEYLKGISSCDHINALQGDVGASRFRPAEVVGAAVVDADMWPVNFSKASELAEQVIADLA